MLQDKLKRILEIFKAELRHTEKDSEYNIAVYNTLHHVIEVIEANIEE